MGDRRYVVRLRGTGYRPVPVESRCSVSATTGVAVKYCTWCDKPAVGDKLTHRPIVRKKNGVATVIAAEVTAPACAKHMGIEHTEDPVVRRAKYAAGCKSRKALQERLV